MLIDLINNINLVFNNLPKYILEILDLDIFIFSNIKNNENVINNKIDIFDFFEIAIFINKITESLTKLENTNEFKIYIETAIFQIKNYIKETFLTKLLDDLLLYFKNANASEINNIFLILDYISYFDDNIKQKFIDILNNKIIQIPHLYFILKKNFNYDVYFSLLIKYKNKYIGLNPSMLQKYNFINNNDFDINSIKINKNIFNEITKNDFYSITNTTLNHHYNDIEKKILLLKKNNNILKPTDILEYKNPEAFLYNYHFYYKELRTLSINKKYKDKIFTYKSMFQIF